MKLKDIIFSFVYIACLFACNNNEKAEPATQAMAAGQVPALTKDAVNNIHVVYGSGDSIMYCCTKDKGISFSKPVLVDTLLNLVAGATRGPQISATKDGVVIIAVNKYGNIYSFIKNNSGRWIRTAKVNDSDSVDKEGFSGLSGDGNKNLFAIWTDVRNDKHNKIYGARSTDGGYTWSKNILVYASPDSTVCECCKPSVAMSGNNVFVMFRNWLSGNRDLYLIQSADGGDHFGQAEKLGTGSWKLNGCPMDGGGLAIAKDGRPQTVWRRHNIIFAAAPGTTEKKIGEGKGCTIEIVNGKNIYAFSKANGDVACVLADGSERILGKGMLPLLASLNDNQVLCMWQHENKIYYRLIQV